MTFFTVSWEANFEAATPEEAARAAWMKLREVNSSSNIFFVSALGKPTTRVDLFQLEQARKRLLTTRRVK